ncbi:MAG: alpha/beta fold hydrolase [Sedimenticolaceae bacterium]
MARTGDDHPAPRVILLHGMARTARSMKPLVRDLCRAGYRVHNVDYPTRPYDVAGLVERYVRPAVAACGSDLPVHVVTHSMGGILIRYCLQSTDLPPGSRIVMLAPPNNGSEVADRVRHWPAYRWFMGPVGQQLGTGPDSIVHRLRPVSAEIGVIAARRSIQPWFSTLIPGPDDGAVSVESTRLAEMRDFIVVDSSHSLMLFNGEVRRQVGHFLSTGRFVH